MDKDILHKIEDAEAVQGLSLKEMEALAGQLRAEISATVARTGGHLASNLGTVELTLALLHHFDLKRDRLVWDVGHQCYSYKMLTGRRALFPSLRQKDGLSGFPKREESPYDAFNTGHSSTAVSAALGLGRALRLRGEEGRAIAVVGDGAMTGGMFYEALNNIDCEKDDILIIVNDNQMSISDNVGQLSKHLNNLRVSRRYNSAKERTLRLLGRLPLIGKGLLYLLGKLKYALRRRLALAGEHVYFETLGLRYYGPIDGHDLRQLSRYIGALKRQHRPAVLQVCTQKGKGYPKAEEAPSLYHGVSPFSLDKGVSEAPIDHALRSYTQAFSDCLLARAERDARIVALTAAMGQGTGLTAFAERFPERYYDVGIAEQHAVTLAAGMAAGGLRPVVCIYATFLQRALDQVLHDVALQNLPLVFAVDRSGLVGADGETHQGLYDSAFLSAVPNLSLLYPCCYAALEEALDWALAQSAGPVAIRYPRGSASPAVEEAYLAARGEAAKTQAAFAPPALPSPRLLRAGEDAVILALGNLCAVALTAAERLAGQGIGVAVVDVARLKPFPAQELRALLAGFPACLCIEEQAAAGGLGESLALALLDAGTDLRFSALAVPDRPIRQASPQESLEDCGLDAAAVEGRIRELLRKNGAPARGAAPTSVSDSGEPREGGI